MKDPVQIVSVIYEASKTAMERVQVNDVVLLVIKTTGRMSIDATPGLDGGVVWDRFTRYLMQQSDLLDDDTPPQA